MHQVRAVEPWKLKFVEEFLGPGDRSAVCRKFGISRKTGYKLAQRYEAIGTEGLKERSRRPHHSPGRTSAELEQAVVDLWMENQDAGPRTLAHGLKPAWGDQVPSPSTILQILRRAEKKGERKRRPEEVGSFERDSPNELWQMDFKGHVRMRAGGRCHPLMVEDDKTRYCLGAQACANETGPTVMAQLTGIFRAHGLPQEMLMDNGRPWGTSWVHVHTTLGVWLIRLGLQVTHGRPRHPQTQGKVERLNRTLKAEVLSKGEIRDLAEAQERFDAWRVRYNTVRPHQSLKMATPGSLWVPSPRRFPERLPEIVYEEGDLVRRVQAGGWISYRGRDYQVPKCFQGCPVAIRPTEIDGVARVYFCTQAVRELDLRTGESRPLRG